MGKSAKAFKRPSAKDKATLRKAAQGAKVPSVREGSGVQKRQVRVEKEVTVMTTETGKKKTGGTRGRKGGVEKKDSASTKAKRDYVELMYGKKRA